MKWSRKRIVVIVALVIGVILVGDCVRVSFRMSSLVADAELGASHDVIAKRLGQPDSTGEWSGSYGEGIMTTYHVPYIWEHPLAVIHVLFSIRRHGSGWSRSVVGNWYVEHSPSVELTFAKDGRLAEVGTTSFSSNTARVENLRFTDTFERGSIEQMHGEATPR